MVGSEHGGGASDTCEAVDGNGVSLVVACVDQFHEVLDLLVCGRGEVGDRDVVDVDVGLRDGLVGWFFHQGDECMNSLCTEPVELVLELFLVKEAVQVCFAVLLENVSIWFDDIGAFVDAVNDVE